LTSLITSTLDDGGDDDDGGRAETVWETLEKKCTFIWLFIWDDLSSVTYTI